MGTRILGEALRVALLAVLIAALGFAALVALAAAYRFAQPEGRRFAPLCSETCSLKTHQLAASRSIRAPVGKNAAPMRAALRHRRRNEQP